YLQLLGLRAHLRGAPHDIHQTPPLQLAERAALDNAHHVAHFGRAFLIVRVELLALPDDALVQRMRHPAADFHHDGLLHPGGNNLADLLVLQCFFGFGFGHVTWLPPQFPARAGWCEYGPDPSSSRGSSSARPSAPWTSETVAE